MAKPTKYAVPICSTLSVLAVIGIIVGLLTSNALVAMILLLPSVVYEVYRTEGKSTKTSSAILLVIFIAEFLLIIFKVNFNLAEYVGFDEKEVGGYLVPLGDIKVIGPTVMGILSIILFTRTRGVYTKWLAVNIFISSFAIIYILDPGVFQDLLKVGVGEGLNKID